MDAKDYLYHELKGLAAEFPEVQFKYAFNPIIFTHIVELLPLCEYQTNDQLADAWIPLSFKFRENFPDDEIAFVSSDSKLSIKEAQFQFNSPAAVTGFEIFAPMSRELSEYSFPTYMPEVAITIAHPINKVLETPAHKIEIDYDLDYYQQAA